jgi:hypothetical protein
MILQNTQLYDGFIENACRDLAPIRHTVTARSLNKQALVIAQKK